MGLPVLIATQCSQSTPKRSRRYYERRDNPIYDDSDIDEIESEPLIVMYPEMYEHDRAFVAVELDQRGNERCRVFHRGKETQGGRIFFLKRGSDRNW